MYKGGVVTSSTCKNSGIKLDHAIQLVGFNEDAEVPYWIGESGHMVIRTRGVRRSVARKRPRGETRGGIHVEKGAPPLSPPLTPTHPHNHPPTRPLPPFSTQFATPGTPTGATTATSTSRWERTRAASPTCLPWSPLSPLRPLTPSPEHDTCPRHSIARSSDRPTRVSPNPIGGPCPRSSRVLLVPSLVPRSHTLVPYYVSHPRLRCTYRPRALSTAHLRFPRPPPDPIPSIRPPLAPPQL